MELLIILRLPWDLDADPPLARSPVRVAEESGTVKVLVLAQEVFI